jgi:hypothetical protein
VSRVFLCHRFSPVFPGYCHLSPQHCDETGSGRQSEVMFLCCPDRVGVALFTGVVWIVCEHRVFPWHASPVLQDPLSFHSITEPSTCSYRIGICVRAVCQHTPTPSPTPIPQADGFKSSFVALLWSAIVSDSSKELRWLINLELATGPAMPLSYLA